MRAIVRPLTRLLPLEDYADGLELRFDDGPPKVVQVWVNPPRALLEEHDRLLKEAQGGAVTPALAAWYAELWSQHADKASHWTADEVLALAGNDTDPALLVWLQNRSLALMAAHRAGQRKK